MRVYLDNASTTPLDSRVFLAMEPFLKEHFGNPSSIHFHGRHVKAAVEEARTKVARILNASTGEIFFTSSATEANNMILLGAVRDLSVKRIISSPTEHHCVLHVLQHIEQKGMAEVIFLEVDAGGNPDIEQLESLLQNTNSKTLVSLMHANNETGTLIDPEEIGKLCQEYEAYFHSDTVQSVGKFPIDVIKAGLNFCSGSAHKFFGPKGVGFLYMNMDSVFGPFLYGGGQERNMRAGTENVYGIIGLAKALELADQEMESRRNAILALRNDFYGALQEVFDDVQINGNQEDKYHYGILNISLPRFPAFDMLSMSLDVSGISASAGSACSSGTEKGSHVLEAMGAPHGRKAIRFSFSHLNTMEEINYAIQQIREIAKRSEPVFKE